MAELSERIEEELSQAFEVKDANALKRYARLMEAHAVGRPSFSIFRSEMQGAIGDMSRDIRVLTESVKMGLAFAEKRFELIDRHFEQVEKRFEQVDKHFEEVDRRFGRLQWGLTFGVTVLALVITAFGLLA